MTDNSSKDPRLDEVKAILRRLQRISIDDPEPAGEDAPPTRPPPPVAQSTVTGLPAPATTRPATDPSAALPSGALPAKPEYRSNRGLWMTIGLLAALGFGVALWRAANEPPQRPTPTTDAPHADKQPSQAATPAVAPAAAIPPSSAAPPSPRPLERTQAQVIAEADGLLRGGSLKAARELLLRQGDTAAADVAWALARSFDPNFVATLAQPDATADIAEATRWYRTWHDAAIKQGLIADSVQLDRIIRSMR